MDAYCAKHNVVHPADTRCGVCPSEEVEMLTNALGHLAPGRTDFRSWTREGLEHFARTAADENLKLRADNKALLEAWRLEVARTQRLASR